MATVLETLLTAEQYARLSDDGNPTELVKGVVITMNPPFPRHGKVCLTIGCLLSNYVEAKKLGQLMSNDSGIITHRGPDTVRGADIAYYSFQRLPAGPFPQSYLSVVPELAVEVRSPSDRWPDILEKVTEYLNAGVNVVCVFDPEPQTVHVFREKQPLQLFNEDQEFVVPELFADFRVPVRKFFE